MRYFMSRGKFAWCLAPGGASGVRSRPAPARRNLGGAKCRWPDACQDRSRRRRWPKASLYKGLASDEDRRPRSVGRDYARLSLDLSPLPRAGGQRPPLVDEPSAFVEAHMGMRALSLGGFSTDDEARLSCGLAPDDDVRSPRNGHRFGEAKIARGTVPRAPNHRATTLYSAGLATRTHDALMRIGGVVPRRRDHSLPRREGHGWVRVAAASDRCPVRADTRSSREEETPFSAKSGGSRGLCRDPVFDVPAHALESNNSTPTSTVPSSTKRHKSINNLRASATIIVLRTPRGPLAVRASNHLASALSFWNIKNCQASWIMPRRTRALPDRANPFSRLREPLSSGEPVRPP